jgi:hypothetical protein
LDVTNVDGHEYGIYALPRRSEKSVKLADTFSDFIGLALDGKIERLLGFDLADDHKPPLKFQPYVVLPPDGGRQ